MLSTLATLLKGQSARAEETLRSVHAIPLIEQRIREAESALQAAKATLASLIQRQRQESRNLQNLDQQHADLVGRAQEALKAGRDDLAAQAAEAIAALENERHVRATTLERLSQKVLNLRNSVAAGHRRIVDLKQGLVAARAVRQEQGLQRRLVKTSQAASSIEDAEALIADVLGAEDPFDRAQILSQIDADLSHETVASRMADAGFGAPLKSTGKDVLARLKAQSS